MGDARLSLESEPSKQFDVLAVDALSGDAIPVHLLTRESFHSILASYETERGTGRCMSLNRYLSRSGRW